jgi:uncharacterized protein YecE (DUF72 family)
VPRRVCVEFRNHTWMTEDNQQETLEFLASHQLPYVCVDMPQAPAASAQPTDMGERLAQLTQLGELLKAGILTEAEFQQQKARILNG